MTNSLFPAFLRLDYHTLYGTHSQVIPTTEWFPTSITGTIGSYLGWDSVPIDAEVMMSNLVTVAKDLFKSTTVYDLATVFTMATPTSPAIPQASVAIGTAGVSTATVPDKATQFTFNFRTSLNGKMKFVCLDAPVGASNFDKQLPGSYSATLQAIIDEIMDDSNAWAGRDGGQPSASISVTLDLNDALRKRYRMA